MKIPVLIAVGTLAVLVTAPAPCAAAGPFSPGSPDRIRAQVLPHEDPPEGLDTDARQRLFWLDFGPSGAQPPGAWFYDDSSQNDAFGWTGGMVRTVRRDRKYGPYIYDFAEGEDAVFIVSVNTSASCRFWVTFGDPERPRGPVRIEVPGTGTVRNIATRAGEFRDVTFEAEPVAGKLAVRFVADSCGSFAIPGLAVYAMPGSQLTPNAFSAASAIQVSEATALTVAPGAAVDSAAVDAASRDLLRQLSWYLIRNRPAEGCFSDRGAWYESAYPTRTLLVAGRLFDEAAFSDAAYDCIDRFVSEQLPDGNWAAHYFGRPGCELSRLERADPGTANLADVGTMMLALLVAVPQADSARQVRYMTAMKKYLDQVVLPNQLPEGAFPNLRHVGVEYRYPYSVATAVQAGVLAAAFGETGDERYRTAAEKAARFLLDGFNRDGRYTFRRHDSPAPELTRSIRFGDLYYVVEGLLWVGHFTPDTELAGTIDQKIENYLWGSGGISSFRINEVLWRPNDDWEASKIGGLLFVLNSCRQTMARRAEDEASRRRAESTSVWIHDLVAYLQNPGRAGGLGVGLDPAAPNGDYAFPASGFAGVGLASTVDLSMIFPRSK